MKKTITLSLLLLTITIAAHPALMLHFCGEELASVGVFSTQVPACCAHDLQPSSTSSASTYSSPECCHDIHLSVSTDDYQEQNRITRPHSFPREGLVLVFRYAPSWSLVSTRACAHLEFPPESTAPLDIRHLTCTYRI